MNIKHFLERRISSALAGISGRADAAALVNHAKSPQFGDYQANGVMALAKQLGMKPRDLGQQLLETLDLSDVASKLELAGPGFINIFISKAFLTGQLQELDRTRLLPLTESAETIVIDYSSPNLAKEMHVGHLRGTIIGDALARTFEFMGHRLIRQNHFGDWGTQFGMLITYMQELKAEQKDPGSELHDLEGFYRAAKEKFDADPVFASAARDNVVKLQAGDAECLRLWQRFIEVSVEHCQTIYDKLDITLGKTDIVPESWYNEQLPAIVTELNNQHLLEESEGARCVFLEEFSNKEGQPLPVIVQKSDGGYLYATTDLAAIRHRCQELQADRVLYVVDARQSLHFQQVFAVARLAGFASRECRLEHLSYGTMMGRDGKPFKTRSGGTVKLAELIDEGIDRAFRLVSEKNPELDEAERHQIAEVVGIAAIKYADLSKNRNSDYIFDWDSMLSFEGNTAPYMLYAYARISSIFRREQLDPAADYPVQIEQEAERQLALKLLGLHEALDALMEDGYPNQLCLYLYELAGIFMQFYEACPVLKAEGGTRVSRLGLCQLTALTLRQGLELLGIKTLEKM